MQTWCSSGRKHSLITYCANIYNCSVLQQSHRSLRTYNWHYMLIAAWIQGCFAGLLCRRTTAGRQMGELMMSLPPRNKFMMSFCYKFPLVGRFQVICDFSKCQGGDRHGVDFPMKFLWIHIMASPPPQHWSFSTVPYGPLYVRKFSDVQYERNYFKASFHIINLAQYCELRTQLRIIWQPSNTILKR